MAEYNLKIPCFNSIFIAKAYHKGGIESYFNLSAALLPADFVAGYTHLTDYFRLIRKEVVLFTSSITTYVRDSLTPGNLKSVSPRSLR